MRRRRRPNRTPGHRTLAADDRRSRRSVTDCQAENDTGPDKDTRNGKEPQRAKRTSRDQEYDRCRHPRIRRRPWQGIAYHQGRLCRSRRSSVGASAQDDSATKSEYLDERCDVLCVTKQSTSIDFGIDFGADNRMSARDLYVPPDTLQGARL